MTDGFRCSHYERLAIKNRYFFLIQKSLAILFFPFFLPHFHQLAFKMSYSQNSTITDPPAGIPRVLISSYGLHGRLTATAASRIPSTRAPKTTKPYISWIVESVATGTAVAVSLWISYFAITSLLEFWWGLLRVGDSVAKQGYKGR